MPLLYGDFQSVVQLAVALNAGYSATVSLVGRSLEDEARIVKSLIADADGLSAADLASAEINTLRELKVGLRSLSGELCCETAKFVSNQEGCVRFWSIVSMVAAILLLFVVTIYKECVAEGGVIPVFSLFLYLPFSFGAGLSVLLIHRVGGHYKSLRKRFESKLDAIQN